MDGNILEAAAEKKARPDQLRPLIGGKALKDRLEALDHYDAIRYADLNRYVPTPVEVLSPKKDFADWLWEAPSTLQTAFSAHWRLVDIHPFYDGHGRTARLLMWLTLIRCGYPPIAVRPEDRLFYIRALQRTQAGVGTEAFDLLLYQRLDSTPGDYLFALTGNQE